MQSNDVRAPRAEVRRSGGETTATVQFDACAFSSIYLAMGVLNRPGFRRPNGRWGNVSGTRPPWYGSIENGTFFRGRGVTPFFPEGGYIYFRTEDLVTHWRGR